MLTSVSNLTRISLTLLLLFAAAIAADTRRLSVYAPQTNYQVDLLTRDGVDYVGLTDVLEPLGRVETRVESGGRLTLVFNSNSAEFQNGRRIWRVATNAHLELSGNFLLLNGRGYIPLGSLPQLLSRVGGFSAEYHAAARRLFIGATPMRFTSELRHLPTRLVLSFPAPVNPIIQNERTRVRLLFRHEPVVGNTNGDAATFRDAFLAAYNFTEVAGGAEFVAVVRQPATVSLGDGGRSIVIQPASFSPIPTPPTPSVNVPSPSGVGAAQHVAPKPRPFVVLDAAHGGFDNGAGLTAGLPEKSVTLAFARRLQHELEARGVGVVLTRSGDQTLGNDQRAVAANTSHATLYLALHASSSGHGVHVYTAMLASNPASGSSSSSPRSFVPWRTAQAGQLTNSAAAASALADACAAASIPTSRSAVPLAPLNSVTLAAVAVELAPLGSAAGELASSSYQSRLAAALADGIVAARGKLESGQ